MASRYTRDKWGGMRLADGDRGTLPLHRRVGVGILQRDVRVYEQELQWQRSIVSILRPTKEESGDVEGSETMRKAAKKAGQWGGRLRATP
jgi:hypothetical protein